MSFLSAPALLVAKKKKKKVSGDGDGWALSRPPSPTAAVSRHRLQRVCGCSWDWKEKIEEKKKPCICFILMIQLSHRCNYFAVSLSRRHITHHHQHHTSSSSAWLKDTSGQIWQHVGIICQILLMHLEMWSRSKHVAQMMVVGGGLGGVGDWHVQ